MGAQPQNSEMARSWFRLACRDRIPDRKGPRCRVRRMVAKMAWPPTMGKTLKVPGFDRRPVAMP
eukprot:scaffold2476_cov193-Amphora_coffeaeformis.AAC.12